MHRNAEGPVPPLGALLSCSVQGSGGPEVGMIQCPFFDAPSMCGDWISRIQVMYGKPANIKFDELKQLAACSWYRDKELFISII